MPPTEADVKYKMIRFYIILTFSLLSTLADADEILIRAKAIKKEQTEYIPDCGDDCMVWAIWNIYTLEVLDVINGNLKQKTLRVAFLEGHSKPISELQNWYLLLDKLGNEDDIQEKLDVRYYVLNKAFVTESLCFYKNLSDLFPADSRYKNVYENKETKEFCYPIKYFTE